MLDVRTIGITANALRRMLPLFAARVNVEARAVVARAATSPLQTPDTAFPLDGIRLRARPLPPDLSINFPSWVGSPASIHASGSGFFGKSSVTANHFACVSKYT